jgi:hypothetical protein
MRRVWVTARNRAALHQAIDDLERLTSHPLGDASFRFDPGTDPFAFLERLGEPKYLALMDGDRVAAVGAGVLRAVPLRVGEAPTRVWYLCDVKVHPDYRGRHLPLTMLAKADFPLNYARAPRAYAIGLNPGDGGASRLVGLMRHFRWARFEAGPELAVYGVDAATIADLTPLLEQFRGHLGMLSPTGVRDLVLASTGEPLPVVHVTWDPLGKGVAPSNRKGPQPGHRHLFCAPHGDPMAIALAARGVMPIATASVVHHRMARSDWRFVLTSEL